MYLSKLDIIGFKSFAQKTQLKFVGGISAVVGPNGCGKTNIVDAIRWALGEQKTSVLRSDVMENVIFNGTKTRKPLSMAEVAITLENNKGILPTEYNEVTIARRLYRSGESEYYINKSKCRLRDIVDLFMDTGLGSDSYSVIELKMVEAILSGRAEERRNLFEEAAGIKKYKLRRKEASKKLEAVQTDLSRVFDLLDEVRKNVNSLGRQAAKTKRYNTLMKEFKELEIKLLTNQFLEFKKSANILTAEVTELNKDKIKNEISLGDMESELMKIKDKYQIIERDYQTAIDAERQLNSQIADRKREIAVGAEKLSGIDSAKERLRREIEDAERSKGRAAENILATERKIEELTLEKEEAENEFADLKTLRDEAYKMAQNARQAASTANERVLSVQNNINSLKSTIRRDNEKRDSLMKRIYQTAEEKQKIQAQIDDLEISLAKADDRKADFEESLSDAENLLKSERERQASLQNEIDSLRHKIGDKKNALGGKKAQLDFLKNLVDAGDTAKFLLNSKDWNYTGEKTLLAEAVGADEEHRLAVSAALAHAGDYFIVDTKEQAYSAFEALKRSSKGKAAFVCMDSIPEIPAGIGAIECDGLVGVLSEMVRVEDKLRWALRGIVGSCVVVDNLDNAWKAVTLPQVDSAVTLSGEVVFKSGVVRGGSVSKSEGGRVGKKERMDALKKEIAEFEGEIDSLESQLRDIREEFQSIDIQALVNSVRKIENEKKAFEQKTAQTELKKQSLEHNLDLIDENTARYGEEIAEIESGIERINSELSEFDAALNLAGEEKRAKFDELETAEEDYKDKNETSRQAELKIVQVKAELNSAENELKRLNGQSDHLDRVINGKNNELILSDRTRQDLTVRLADYKEELALAEISVEEAKNNRDFLAQEKSSHSEMISQYSDNISNIRKTYDRVKEAIHEKEIKLSERRAHLETIVERFKEEYETDPETSEISAFEDFSVEEAKKELVEIKSKLGSLGNVNFMALEDFEKESERLAFLEKQVQDLTESEKTLKETIEEINIIAERNFRETYDKIHENFKNLFKKLFGEEGEAELKINDDNILESDIEIMAKPPNKRPNSIEQLSGGEKTLTAIALLFAIYLVKPSPFCILDEVDAPLDDANVDKYINLIKEFSRDTQFLMVTHNKKTMAASDTLYGVTQQEIGVSKTVAVRLDRNEVKF